MFYEIFTYSNVNYSCYVLVICKFSEKSKSFALNIRTSRKRVKTSNPNNMFLVLVCYASDLHIHIWWSVETNDKTAQFCDKLFWTWKFFIESSLGNLLIGLFSKSDLF